MAKEEEAIEYYGIDRLIRQVADNELQGLILAPLEQQMVDQSRERDGLPGFYAAMEVFRKLSNSTHGELALIFNDGEVTFQAIEYLRVETENNN